MPEYTNIYKYIQAHTYYKNPTSFMLKDRTSGSSGTCKVVKLILLVAIPCYTV